MQIVGGFITVTNGSATVTGSGDYNWTNVEVNNWLVINGVIYFIADITNALTGTLILSEAYRGSNATTASYVIVRDFTASRSLPLVNPGDQEVAALLSRAMQIIDPLLGGTAAGEEVALAQTAHGFAVGNCLYLNGTTWAMANASASATSNVVAMVCEVVDVNNFTIKTNGLVSGITGITLVPKTVYYLRPSITSSLNLTLTAPTTPNVVLPMLVAVTSNSGFLLSLGIARPDVFTTTNNGLVPAPNASTGFLKYDRTWSTAGVTDASIQARHINNVNTTIDYDALDDPSSAQSLIRHIQDLNTRIDVIESQTNGGNFVRHVFTRDITTGTTGVADITGIMTAPKKVTLVVGGVDPFDIPTSAGYIVVTAISGTPVKAKKSGQIYRIWEALAPYKVKFAIPVIALEQLHIYIGVPRKSKDHTSNYHGATNIIVYKGNTKIIDLVGNMRSGKRVSSGADNYTLWEGKYIHPSITSYAVHPTELTVLPTAYGDVENADWFSTVTVPLKTDTAFSNPTNESQDFWAGMAIVEWGFGASPFAS